MVEEQESILQCWSVQNWKHKDEMQGMEKVPSFLFKIPTAVIHYIRPPGFCSREKWQKIFNFQKFCAFLFKNWQNHTAVVLWSWSEVHSSSSSTMLSLLGPWARSLTFCAPRTWYHGWPLHILLKPVLLQYYYHCSNYDYCCCYNY